jgi:hypothetical protein
MGIVPSSIVKSWSQLAGLREMACGRLGSSPIEQPLAEPELGARPLVVVGRQRLQRECGPPARPSSHRAPRRERREVRGGPETGMCLNVSVPTRRRSGERYGRARRSRGSSAR